MRYNAGDPFQKKHMQMYESWSESDEKSFLALQSYIDKEEEWVRKLVTKCDDAVDQFRPIELITRPPEDLISLTRKIASYEQ